MEFQWSGVRVIGISPLVPLVGVGLDMFITAEHLARWDAVSPAEVENPI